MKPDEAGTSICDARDSLQATEVSAARPASGIGDAPLGLSDLAVVVVIFEPPTTVNERLRSYGRAFRQLIVVDNSAVASHAIELGSPHSEFLWQGNLGGIAGALNRGVAHAEHLGFRLVLLLDQDSVVDAAQIARALLFFAPDVGIVAIQPRLHHGAASPIGSITSPTIDVPVAITSGSIVSLDAWRRCGTFDESLFIDYVDHDFCLRLRRAGYRIVELAGSTMEHALGEQKHGSLFGRPVSYTSHQPFRAYYIMRNGMFVAFRYMSQAPRVSMGVLRVLITEVLKTLAFEDRKRLRLKYMAIGLFHWAINRYGPQLHDR